MKKGRLRPPFFYALNLYLKEDGHALKVQRVAPHEGKRPEKDKLHYVAITSAITPASAWIRHR